MDIAASTKITGKKIYGGSGLLQLRCESTLHALSCTLQISAISMGAEGAGIGNMGAFRALRTLRALRPLRAVSRWEGMKVTCISTFTTFRVSKNFEKELYRTSRRGYKTGIISLTFLYANNF